MNIAIIGGSIAGCACAILLSRAGHNVSIYEKSAAPLRDRGAGIAMPKDFVDDLIVQDVLDKDTLFFNNAFRSHRVKDDSFDKIYGRDLLTNDMNLYKVSWSTLYQQLRKRVPDECYNKGIYVKNVYNCEDAIEIEIEGQCKKFDLVIGCDGYQSHIRPLIIGNVRPEFCEYVAWRGTTSVKQEDQKIFTKDTMYFYFYERGHSVMYSVPLFDSEQGKPVTVLTWLIYDKVDPKKRGLFLTDNEGNETYTIPPDKIQSAQVDYVKNLAQHYFPQVAANLIAQTNRIFMQGMHDLYIDHYVKGRLCVVGDSSTVLRPHTGGGTTRAIQDAIALTKALGETDDLDQALVNWEIKQLQVGEMLFDLGRDLGGFMVTNPPDWNTISNEEFKQKIADIYGKYDWYLLK